MGTIIIIAIVATITYFLGKQMGVEKGARICANLKRERKKAQGKGYPIEPYDLRP